MDWGKGKMGLWIFFLFPFCLPSAYGSSLAHGIPSDGEVPIRCRNSRMRPSGFLSRSVVGGMPWTSSKRDTWLRGQLLASCRARRLQRDGQRRHDGKLVARPSMALDPDTVYTANEWIAGVAGGSVGVLGTLIQLELRQVLSWRDAKKQEAEALLCRFQCQPWLGCRFSNVDSRVSGPVFIPSNCIACFTLNDFTMRSMMATDNVLPWYGNLENLRPRMWSLRLCTLAQERVRSRRNCPFCNGTGTLICGECCSSGKVLVKLPGESSPAMVTCHRCNGEKYVTCFHCGGDGRAVPRSLDKKTLTAAEVDMRLEEIGMSNDPTVLPGTPQR